MSDSEKSESEEPNPKKSKTSDKASEDNHEAPITQTKEPTEMKITTRTGGAYIPPAKLRLMQKEIADKSSDAYQRLSWDLLKKSIHGLVNRVNSANVSQIVTQLFAENLVRGRGLFAKSVIEAQAFSPTFTPVYAALIAIVNSKFPQIGELVIKRLVINFRKSWKRNQKAGCVTTLQLLAHLVNQQVAHEVVALELLFLLFQSPTDASVELAVAFIKEIGLKLTELSPRGMNTIFEKLRSVLHEGAISERVQYMVELVHAVRKDGFKAHPSIPEALDLVCDGDQYTHVLQLDQVEMKDTEDKLNVYRHDPEYVENEAKYEGIKRSLLGEDSDSEGEDDSDGDGDGDGSSSADDEGEGENATGEGKTTIMDQTETNLMGLRRTVYLTIQSALTFEECAHKLLKMDVKPELYRSYEKFYGLLAARFCLLKKEFMQCFEVIFKKQYETIHRLDSNKLRNTAKIFGHLLFSDALPWTVLECIHLNEDETTSSSRIFIKHLFQELAEHMGMERLNKRLSDPTLQLYFEGLMPRDNPKHTRFAINMFTSIGLGLLTEDLRAHLEARPTAPAVPGAGPGANLTIPTSDDDDSSSDSDSSDSSSESSSSSSSDSADLRRTGTGTANSSRRGSVHSNSSFGQLTPRGTPKKVPSQKESLRRAAIERSRASGHHSSDEEPPPRSPRVPHKKVSPQEKSSKSSSHKQKSKKDDKEKKRDRSKDRDQSRRRKESPRRSSTERESKRDHKHESSKHSRRDENGHSEKEKHSKKDRHEKSNGYPHTETRSERDRSRERDRENKHHKSSKRDKRSGSESERSSRKDKKDSDRHRDSRKKSDKENYDRGRERLSKDVEPVVDKIRSEIVYKVETKKHSKRGRSPSD